jgi:hypothetical protein
MPTSVLDPSAHAKRPVRPPRRRTVRMGRRCPASAAALAVVVALALLTLDGGQLDALQRMAGYTTGKTFFTDAQKYLDNLRDSLIPLAIPIGAIGLTGGGVAYMVGNVMAQKILGGVVIGLAVALMGPSIVA